MLMVIPCHELLSSVHGKKAFKRFMKMAFQTVIKVFAAKIQVLKILVYSAKIQSYLSGKYKGLNFCMSPLLIFERSKPSITHKSHS